MTGLLKSLVIRFIKSKWGSILPAVFKAAAEGGFGPKVKAVYWWLAGKKTIAGAVITAVGVALEHLCANFPAYGWSCSWGKYVYLVGGILFSVGLVDGGTRAPWPDGAQAEHKELP